MEQNRKKDLVKQFSGVLGAEQRDTGTTAMKTNDTVTDPVCGMSVKPDAAAATAAYQEQTYYFCSAHCHAKFVKDPATYVDGRSGGASGTEPAHHEPHAPLVVEREAAPAPGKNVTIYTCPMHPEVRQPGPGACPKCGMALEPEIPVAVVSVEYTCPMHPEIVRGEPGNCPICGMALEPRTAPTTAAENAELIEMTRRFWASTALALPVFIPAMVGVPIAAGVLYPFFGLLLSPIVAVAAMSFSSVSVVTNALRLNRVKL